MITSTADDPTRPPTDIGAQNPDGSYSGTLRQAINYANLNAANPSTSTTIRVALPAGSAPTVTLGGNLPLIATSIQFDGLDATGGSALTINGGGAFRGFLVSGIAADGVNAAPTTVDISNVAFVSTKAQGGMGAGSGGGGLGAGGAIFVGPAANVTLANVDMSSASAVGGSSQGDASSGAGGGLTGAGGSGQSGGGGGILYAGANGSGSGGGRGGGGGISGSAVGFAGGAGLNGQGGGGNGGANGKFGGGGGGGYVANMKRSQAGSGGFGGGGGAGGNFAGNGGFGGGGGTQGNGGPNANGGFGGGGGGEGSPGGANGGFAAGGGSILFGSYQNNGGSGGGTGGSYGASGGSGASLGGAIFVAAGGRLTIAGSSTESGSNVTAVIAKNGGGSGAAHGGGIFFQGTNGASTALNFGMGTQTYSDEITDYIGSGGTNPNGGTRASDTGGSVTVVKSGTGSLTLSGVNTYTGGTTISAGTVVAAHADGGGTIDALGGGAIALAGGTLRDGLADANSTLANAVTVGSAGGTIDVGTATSLTVLTLNGAITGTGDLTFTAAAADGANAFAFVAQDTHTGATILGGNVTVAGSGQANTFSAASAFEIDRAATLFLGADQTIASLADGPNGGGTVIPGLVSQTLTLAGSATTRFSGTLADGGFFAPGPLALIKAGSGTQTLAGASTYSGGTTIRAGTLDLEAATTVDGNGTATMGAAGTGVIAFQASVPSAPLAAPTTVLELGTVALPESGGTFANTLDDFGDAGEAIDLRGFSGALTATFTPDALGSTNGTLTVISLTRTARFRLTDASAAAYTVRADEFGDGTLVEALCFAQGTAIRVLRDGAEDDVAVEDLRVGDLAVTASGDHRPIRWLCHRTLDCAGHPRLREIMPIRIAAQAFGPDRPARDLDVSPGHPVLVGADADGAGGVLVPIMCLINGTTIRRVAAEAVIYWHVELDAHDILLAEGLPAESYVDLGTREWFAGGDGLLSNPDLVLAEEPGRCRPVAIDGPLVEAERRRLDVVFAARLAIACAWPGAAAIELGR